MTKTFLNACKILEQYSTKTEFTYAYIDNKKEEYLIIKKGFLLPTWLEKAFKHKWSIGNNICVPVNHNTQNNTYASNVIPIIKIFCGRNGTRPLLHLYFEVFNLKGKIYKVAPGIILDANNKIVISFSYQKLEGTTLKVFSVHINSRVLSNKNDVLIKYITKNFINAYPSITSNNTVRRVIIEDLEYYPITSFSNKFTPFEDFVEFL